MIYRLKIKEILFTVIFFLMIFHGVLEEKVGILSLTDEIFALIVFTIGILNWISHLNYKINRYLIFILSGLIIFNFMGWVSSYNSGYRDIKISILSFFLSNKFFLTFIGTICILTKTKLAWLKKYLTKYARIMVILLAIWQLLACQTGLIPEFSEVNLCAKTVLLLSFIIYTWNKKKDYMYCVIAVVLLFSTHKAKAYGAIAILCFIGIWILYLKKKIRLAEIVLGTLSLITLTWEKLYYYFVYGLKAEFPRIMMLKYGAKIANEYFPLGTGWGTFGSYYAALDYSPIYQELGWAEHSTLGVHKTYFLNDVFWPTVYCEAGWLGFLGYCLVLVGVFAYIQRMYRIDIRVYCAAILSFFYLLITTLESTAYSHPSLIMMAVLWGMTYSEMKNNNRNEGKCI